MQGCSFHDGGLPASTAQEIMLGWQTERAKLEAPSTREGCARRTIVAQRTHTVPPIAIWQAYSGNNSGECVMVAKFEAIADASAYLALLLPSWVPESSFPPEWRRLLVEERVSVAPVSEWRETPRELLAIGRTVMAIGYEADDMFPELRALAWKKGAHVIPGGVHIHDGLCLLAAVRAANEQQAQALASAPPHPAAATYLHGDVVLLTLALMDGERAPDSIGEAHRLLAAYAGNRPLAAEMLFETVDDAAMIAVKKRLGAAIPKTPRLAVGFWGEDAESKAASFARLVDEGKVTVAGTCALISGIERRKRLALLAYRRGAYVTALDGAEVVVHGHLFLPPLAPRKGQRAEHPAIEVDAVKAAIGQKLFGEFRVAVTPANSWNYGPTVEIRTTDPARALSALAQVAQELHVSLRVWVREIDPLALAVRRIIAEVRS